ncbi:MAG: hypothetical protein ACXQTE_01070 [Methanosarcinaceae archaeon]
MISYSVTIKDELIIMDIFHSRPLSLRLDDAIKEEGRSDERFEAGRVRRNEQDHEAKSKWCEVER